ncbi:hypothetical protein [Nostoc sp. WHI]|uniref:hypothetical protein n=1 Tax=Nostoc sp. WHI TaxID=2650611 RepID=UPI0018C6CE53|nr:hypothetical protein [Nostoc sp. WHI]MBG1270516.1 hypothetical protein [Nostoc sp. WHI]
MEDDFPQGLKVQRVHLRKSQINQGASSCLNHNAIAIPQYQLGLSISTISLMLGASASQEQCDALAAETFVSKALERVRKSRCLLFDY